MGKVPERDAREGGIWSWNNTERRGTWRARDDGSRRPKLDISRKVAVRTSEEPASRPSGSVILISELLRHRGEPPPSPRGFLPVGCPPDARQAAASVFRGWISSAFPGARSFFVSPSKSARLSENAASHRLEAPTPSNCECRGSIEPYLVRREARFLDDRGTNKSEG
ncbi:hypothetical protein KM043_000361 [Ampulex compressa]|nr:hypothetical protein KM043_000361 [Ampulex compressa]